MKSYQKNKDKTNSPGPAYRTPDFFKIQNISKRPNVGGPKFNPAGFKIQHKG